MRRVHRALCLRAALRARHGDSQREWARQLGEHIVLAQALGEGLHCLLELASLVSTKRLLVHRRHSQQVEQQVDRANPARLILEASVHLTHEAARLLPPSVLNKRGGPSREAVQLADHLLL